MKAFCFIFSFYLLLLSVQPCQDFEAGGFSDASAEDERQTLVLHGSSGETEKETHECSPFCICSCRQVSASYNLTVLSIPEAAEAVAATSRANLYQNNYSNQYPNSIWQPPKI
ncbi:MAG TPA: DUF6660 family protein [Pyrinomonadaceae bacterium]|jgi:hypothetical protein